MRVAVVESGLGSEEADFGWVWGGAAPLVLLQRLSLLLVAVLFAFNVNSSSHCNDDCNSHSNDSNMVNTFLVSRSLPSLSLS